MSGGPGRCSAATPEPAPLSAVPPPTRSRCADGSRPSGPPRGPARPSVSLQFPPGSPGGPVPPVRPPRRRQPPRRPGPPPGHRPRPGRPERGRQVARDLGPVADGQTERTHEGAADARGNPLRHSHGRHPHVVGDQDRPGPDGRSPGRAVRERRPEIGGHLGEGMASDLGQCMVLAALQGSVEKARNAEFRTQPAGELVPQRHDGAEIVLGEMAGAVGHEGHDIEHAQARVRSLVRAEIEAGHDGRSQCPHRREDLVDVADQGEYGTVMVGVRVQIEQDGRGRGSQFSQKGLVTALAHVDHALDDHAGARVRGGKAVRRSASPPRRTVKPDGGAGSAGVRAPSNHPRRRGQCGSRGRIRGRLSTRDTLHRSSAPRALPCRHSGRRRPVQPLGIFPGPSIQCSLCTPFLALIVEKKGC